jgi:hypothetical protein
VLAAFVAERVAALDYPNFKSEVAKTDTQRARPHGCLVRASRAAGEAGMNLTMLSDVESLYGEDARRGEVIAFARRRPLPPVERMRRAVERACRGIDLICGDTVYGDPRPREEAALVFPRLADPDE